MKKEKFVEQGVERVQVEKIRSEFVSIYICIYILVNMYILMYILVYICGMLFLEINFLLTRQKLKTKFV